MLRGLAVPQPTCLPGEKSGEVDCQVVVRAMTKVLKVLWGCRKGQPVLPGNLGGSWEAGWRS